MKNKQTKRKSKRKQESRQFPYDSKDLWCSLVCSEIHCNCIYKFI